MKHETIAETMLSIPRSHAIDLMSKVKVSPALILSISQHPTDVNEGVQFVNFTNVKTVADLEKWEGSLIDYPNNKLFGDRVEYYQSREKSPGYLYIITKHPHWPVMITLCLWRNEFSVTKGNYNTTNYFNSDHQCIRGTWEFDGEQHTVTTSYFGTGTVKCRVHSKQDVEGKWHEVSRSTATMAQHGSTEVYSHVRSDGMFELITSIPLSSNATEKPISYFTHIRPNNISVNYAIDEHGYRIPTKVEYGTQMYIEENLLLHIRNRKYVIVPGDKPVLTSHITGHPECQLKVAARLKSIL